MVDEIIAVKPLIASTRANNESLCVVELGLGDAGRDLFGVLEDGDGYSRVGYEIEGAEYITQ